MIPFDLDALVATPKTGDEPFTHQGARIGIDLRQFWSWACSDLISKRHAGRARRIHRGAGTGVRQRRDTCGVGHHVFSVFKHTDKGTANPLDVDQWDFYVLSTERLNVAVGEQTSVTLSSLLKHHPAKVSFAELQVHIERQPAIRRMDDLCYPSQSRVPGRLSLGSSTRPGHEPSRAERSQGSSNQGPGGGADRAFGPPGESETST